jgi:hypothetical protein
MNTCGPRTLKDGHGNIVYVDDWRWEMQYARTPWFDEEIALGDLMAIVKELDRMDAEKVMKNNSQHSIDESKFVC